MKADKAVLRIEFDSQEDLMNFASWLCEAGEQDYWNYQEIREKPAVTFDYHNQDISKATDDPSRYNEFMADNTIRTKPYGT